MIAQNTPLQFAHDGSVMTSEYFMEYSVEHKRELTEEEIKLVSFLLTDSGNDSFMEQLTSLRVVARCGCGKCPTVLFAQGFDSPIVKSASDLTQYQGMNKDGEMVGVTLMAIDGKLTELEASSFSGGDIWSWPPINQLRAVGS